MYVSKMAMEVFTLLWSGIGLGGQVVAAVRKF